MIDSKVLAILLNGWIFPICGVASERVCTYSLHSRFFLMSKTINLDALDFVIFSKVNHRAFQPKLKLFENVTQKLFIPNNKKLKIIVSGSKV